MSTRPIGLTDEQLALIRSAARHIPPADRCKFLQAVADALSGQEIGDGTLHSAVRLALANAQRWTMR